MTPEEEDPSKVYAKKITLVMVIITNCIYLASLIKIHPLQSHEAGKFLASESYKVILRVFDYF